MPDDAPNHADSSPEYPNSEILVGRARTGNSEAIAALLERHLPALKAYLELRAGKLVRAKVSIGDLVQSVCCDVLEDLSGFEYRGEAQFKNWLFKRALHKVMNTHRHYRAKKRDAEQEVRRVTDDNSKASYYASMCTPSRHAMGKEDMLRFEAAFDQLDEDHKEAITLYRIVGMSYEEIATEMSRSQGAVRNLVYRGLARLSTILSA